MIMSLFRKKTAADPVYAVYNSIVAQSRRPVFYAQWGVPDTVTGRFDMISLHMALLFRRLRNGPEGSREFSQAVFDLFFKDMDRSLREMGVSDLGVPKKIQKMGNIFFGLLAAMNEAMDRNDADVLAGVLAVLGYSVNESVVIFDRIREAFRKYRKMNTHEVIDHAITSTISRTIITHGSTEMMVVSMLVFGGPTLHYFALALTIGILFGIYSSVFVAAALCMWLGVKREDLVKSEKKAGGPKEDDPNFGAQV